MELELVISDLDGTIVETENYHRLAYNELFKELGLDDSWSKQDYAHRLQTMGGNKFREIFSWLNLTEDKYEQSKQRLYARKTELYVELITHDLTAGQLCLRPGIEDYLKKYKIREFRLL
jgi:phosphoglycolate phosphatase-like HAD superfamily hydrolase